MAINQQQITADNGVALKETTINPTPAASQTAKPVLLRQVPFGFTILGASVYCRTYTALLSAQVGFVPVGKTLADVVLAIATTVTKFKLNSAVLGLSGTKNPNTDLATIVQKAVTDNLSFSSAYTINVAAATGQFWGAFRVQMAADGTISTRAYAQDQRFLSEADALRNCPPAAANMVDLGTITIESATGVAFTCGTTALNAAGTTVNYHGAASGFVSALTGAMTFVAATIVEGTMVSEVTDRTTQHPGALLVAEYTSDGTMAVTDPEINIRYRPYPLNNEAPFQE